MSIILNGQTNDITVGGVGVTLDTESKLKADKSTTLTEHFSKQNKKAVVFTKTAPAGFSVLPNKVEFPSYIPKDGEILAETIAKRVEARQFIRENR